LAAFKFKEFTLFKNVHSHKLGTDAMLLGAFCQTEIGLRGLDAGAGSGVLGLMMAQKFPSMQVDCVEADPQAHEECAYNLVHSPFSARMNAFCEDINSFKKPYAYDLIVSNPPYYFSNNPSTTKNKLQKHMDMESVEPWLAACFSMLSPNGSFWIIYPENESKRFEGLFHTLNLFPSESIGILNQHGACIRKIAHLRKQSNTCDHTTFTLRDRNGDYSEAYKSLTHAFHHSLPKR
jgi:tRNA1Val (adenine37-N6)-methyltransferase